MRVLHIGVASPKNISGGLNRFVDELASAERTAGLQVVVIGADSEVSADGAVTETDAQGSWASESALKRLRRMRRLTSALIKRFDVVDSHFAWHTLPAVGLASRRRPLVVHFHGPWGAETAAGGGNAAAARLKHWVEKYVYQRADKVVTLTEVFRAEVCARFGVDPGKVVVIPPGVDVQRFAPADRVSARRFFGLEATRPVIVAVRRLVPRMGLDDLIRALVDIDAELLIVGDGSERANLGRLCEEIGVRDRVIFAGRVADEALAMAYSAADVSVIPTRALEGFGLVALESLACGTPVVARAQGGLVEALDGFDPRSLVLDSSVSELASAIRGMLAAPTPVDECLAFAQERSWGATAASTIAVYEQVASALG